MDTESPTENVVLTAAEVLAIRSEAVDRGAPAAPQQIDRPDGQPGYAAQIAGAVLLPPEVARARKNLDRARQGGDEAAIRAAQLELADAAGLKLRNPTPPPAKDEGPLVAELVATDLLNLQAKVRPRALVGDDLGDVYEDVLRVAIGLRAAIEDERRRVDAGDELTPPVPVVIRNGGVIVVQGVAWQRRDGEWHPLALADQLDDDTRAAIAEHIG